MAVSAGPMTPAEQKAHYDERGYVTYPDMLAASEVAVLQAALAELLEEAAAVPADVEMTEKFSFTQLVDRRAPRAADLQPDRLASGVHGPRPSPAHPRRRREPDRPGHPAPPHQAQPEAAGELATPDSSGTRTTRSSRTPTTTSSRSPSTSTNRPRRTAVCGSSPVSTSSGRRSTCSRPTARSRASCGTRA